ncbi:hypothetical protein GCM10009767_06340 [Kocuria aegyptia]|uniref:Uncharacterized protein n=1 Tax=Kocuria aegyptia TaxID=330943 RepID=A0ABP4WC16_9MICC
MHARPPERPRSPRGAASTTGGPPKGCTGLVLDDEFPLSMFSEALGKELMNVKESTAGTRATEA